MLIKDKDNIYLEKTLENLNYFYNEIENKEISTKNFFSFLNNKEENILEKLNLFNLLNKVVNPKEIYIRLKYIYNEINKTFKDLNFIKNELLIYHNEIKQKEINKISDIIMNGKIIEYENLKKEIIYFMELKDMDKISNIKNLNIFNIFYKYSKGNNQEEHFNNALVVFKTIKNNLKLNNNINDEGKNENNNFIKEINDELININKFESKQEYEKIIYLFIKNEKNNDEELNNSKLKNFENKFDEETLKNIDNLKKELKEKEIKIEELYKKLNNLEKELKNNLNKNKELNEINEELKKNLNNNQNEIIIELTKQLMTKDKEIKELKLNIPFELNKGEKLISLIFKSKDESFIHSIICKNTQNFVEIEKLLYDIYPEYKNNENIFKVNGRNIDKYQSLEDNKIKNNDIINLE